MNKFYIGFSTNKNFNLVSKLIQFIEKTDFSHVYVRFWSEKYQRNVIYEASGTCVKFKANWIFHDKSNVIEEYEVAVSDDVYMKVMQFCLDNASVPYGLSGLLGFAWVYAGRLFGKEWKNPFRDGKKTYVCSELASVILEEASGVALETDDITPKILRNFMNEKFKRVVCSI